MEKERVSVIVTEDTAKRFSIAPVFMFQQDMTLQEAAEAVSGMIQENGCYLPVEWFQFAEKPMKDKRILSLVSVLNFSTTPVCGQDLLGRGLQKHRRACTQGTVYNVYFHETGHPFPGCSRRKKRRKRMKDQFIYHFELSQGFEEEDIPLKKTEKFVTEKPWYGHSYGDRVGRIYLDGRKESFFVKDQEQGNTKLFDQMVKKNITYPHVHSIYDRKTGEIYNCEDHYILRDVIGHSSHQPTVTDDALDTCMNVGFTYHYEILLVLDEDWKRYITQTIRTHGPFTYGLYDIMTSLGDIIEEWAEEGENGFWKDEEGIHALFYDLFGEEIEESFSSVNALLVHLNSVRIFEIERERDER